MTASQWKCASSEELKYDESISPNKEATQGMNQTKNIIGSTAKDSQYVCVTI